jgi:hypothetical protein
MDIFRSRSRLLPCMLAILLITAFVTPVSAEGLFGMGLPGLPSFGGWPGGAAGCGEKLCPGGLKFDVGYLWGHRGMTFGFDAKGPLIAGVDVANRFTYPLEGLWLGLTAQAPLKDDLGVILRGTWLVPSNQRVHEEFAIPGVGFVPSREWGTKIQYYTLDAAAVYPFCAPFNVLGGFRFDSLDTDFKDPKTETDYSNSRPTDRAELSFTGYIPYVGVGVNYGQALRLSFIGTPILWGELKIRETLGGGNQSWEWKSALRNGYFMEASAEYGLDVGVGRAALLAKWTYLHATSRSATGTFQGGGSGDFSMDLDRQNYLLAGSFTVPLASPW